MDIANTDENSNSPILPAENGDPQPIARTGDGKFAPGWKGGPGRPAKPKLPTAEALEAMFACTAEDWAAIHKALVREAKKGSAPHIKILAEYNFAKPAENLVVQSTG